MRALVSDSMFEVAGSELTSRCFWQQLPPRTPPENSLVGLIRLQRFAKVRDQRLSALARARVLAGQLATKVGIMNGMATSQICSGSMIQVRHMQEASVIHEMQAGTRIRGTPIQWLWVDTAGS